MKEKIIAQEKEQHMLSMLQQVSVKRVIHNILVLTLIIYGAWLHVNGGDASTGCTNSNIR